jgi:aspartate carbamoyltransferase catalytic subunit
MFDFLKLADIIKKMNINKKNMRHFSKTEDFNKQDYLEIFRRADFFEKGLGEGKNFAHLCPGKVIATEFFQESTRTSASFQAAMVKLGGGWFGVSGIKGTYLESGEEDIEDTLMTIAPFCDVMAVRHKNFDLSTLIKKNFPVPLINGMCGGEEHSLAGMLYPYVGLKRFGKLEGIKIGIYGMSKSSRPIKAAAKVLGLFNVEIIEDSVIPEMKTPSHIVQTIIDNGSSYREDKLDNFIDKIDCLFIVEGLPQAGEDPKLVDAYNNKFNPITNIDLDRMKNTAIVDVAYPRSLTDGRLVALKETDDNPKVITEELMRSVVLINMALITYLLDISI